LWLRIEGSRIYYRNIAVIIHVAVNRKFKIS
jgi:hypothetical protein